MDTVDWDAAKFWLDLLKWLMAIVVAIVLWVRSGRNQNGQAVSKLERRVLTIEEHLKHAPTHEDIAKLREEVSGIQSALNANTTMVQRMHDYLLNKKD